MKKLFVSLTCFTLFGCSAAMQPAKVINLPYQFDEIKAKQQLENGKEVLSGSAFLRQNGGGVVNCAGSDVDLYPYSQYSDARIQAQHPVDIWLGGRIRSNDTFVPAAPQFDSIKLSTTCDAQGNFEFNSIKSGDYIAVTRIVWYVPSQYGQQRQGGYVIKNVTVRKGVQNKIVISQ